MSNPIQTNSEEVEIMSRIALKVNLINKWEEQATRLGKNISREWIYGDRLYGEEFVARDS